VVLQREPGDSSHLAAAQAVPGFGEVDDAAAAAHYWRVLYNERAMQDALVSTFGAIGLFDQGLMVIQDLPLVALEFEGKRASEEAVRSGDYPLFKDLAFVIPDENRGQEADPLALEFISFVFSSRGQEMIRKSGYVPLEPPPRSSFAQMRSFGPLPEGSRVKEQGETGETETGEDEAETGETETETETGEGGAEPGEGGAEPGEGGAEPDDTRESSDTSDRGPS
jgi:hypothetical protein